MAEVASCRRRLGGGGEGRFYCPPAMRGRQQQQQQKQQMIDNSSKNNNVNNNINNYKVKSKGSSVQPGRRTDSDDGPSAGTTTSFSSPETRKDNNVTNLDRFLEHTVPSVIAQQFPKTSIRAWKRNDEEFHTDFILGDLWESFQEWSAYGAGVPLVLNGSDSVVQYYVPYLSGIQLYIDPSKPFVAQKKPIDESNAESSRETSSDSSSEGIVESASSTHGTWRNPDTMNKAIQGFSSLSLRNNHFTGMASAEGEIRNSAGLLIFEYLEQEPPYGREPLADKISVLASRFPEIKTLRSCDLTPASWISVAWYPIYRIPTGPTLQNLDACFLTYHLLSTPLKSTSNDQPHLNSSAICRGLDNNGMSMKLSLPIFGLAYYKFRVSFWNSDGVHECQETNSLLRAADKWLQRLQVNHPDYSFFMSRNLYLK